MTAAQKEAAVNEPSSVVIIGGGLAGAKTAEALREQGYGGPVTLLGAEDDLPYERPPLSKAYLAGKSQFDDALVQPAQWYADNDVDLRRGTEAVALDRPAQQVVLGDGSRLGYGSAGARHRLRTAAAADPGRRAGAAAAHAARLPTRSGATFGAGRRLVIIGGGWIGLEVAAAAREAGTEVTVLEAAALPLLGCARRRRWRRCSPTCTASTASTCDSASR